MKGLNFQPMAMHSPPHPGLSVRYDCLESLGLSVTEAAVNLTWYHLQASYGLAQARRSSGHIEVKRSGHVA